MNKTKDEAAKLAPLYYDETEVATLGKMSVSALQKARHYGTPGYPPFIRRGRRVLYPVAQFQAWLAAEQAGAGAA